MALTELAVWCWLQLIPVMRAGMVLLDQASSTLPMSETYHVGLERDERTLKVSRDNCQSSLIS